MRLVYFINMKLEYAKVRVGQKRNYFFNQAECIFIVGIVLAGNVAHL